MPINIGPPLFPHVIRGACTATEPGIGIDVLMQRHVQLKEWRLRNAADTNWRCYWPLSSGGEIMFKGETHPLKPGWLYLISPHTAFDSVCVRPFRKWYIHFTLGGLSHSYGPGIVRIRPTARMRRILAQTCPATNRAGKSPPAYPNALATFELVVLALESAFADQKAWPAANLRVVNCIGFMRERLKEKLTLNSLARFVGTSPRTLTQMFVTETGFPPIRYLIELRLNHAMSLLRSTSDSIEQIADECGFGNRFYFTRMFTRYRSVTPVSFRINGIPKRSNTHLAFTRTSLAGSSRMSKRACAQ